MMRTFGVLAGSLSTTVAVMVFLGVSGGLFAKALLGGEGGLTPVAVLWALSAAPVLPVLTAVLTMRLVVDERTSGRVELVLSAPVRERSVVVGKFLGAWLHAALALALYLSVPLVLLPRCAPALSAHLTWDVFLPAYGALLMQAALWCACGLLSSVCFRPAAVAAVVSLVVTVVLPFAAYQAAFTWLHAFRVRFSEHPFAGHVVDLTTGLVQLSTLLFYFAFTACALFAAAKALALLRFCGRGWRGARISTTCAVVLGFAFATCAYLFVDRFNLSVELPMRGGFTASDRTRQILAETSGEPVYATCFLSQRAPAYRAVRRLLRGLEATAHGVAGVQLSVTGVDPRWDLGAAERLVKAGVPEGTLLFRQGRRQVAVSVGDLFAGARNGTLAVTTEALFEAESACATAVQRLSVAGRRGTLYWTTGHGESSASSYDVVYGMSDIARELRQNGYRIKAIDLSQRATVPEDCAVLVVAGAREPFSRTEAQRVDGFLRGGGRLLVLAAPSPNAGVGPLLADWGVQQLPCTAVSPSRTFNGADVLVTDFGDHALTRPLADCTLLFEGASVLQPTAAADTNAVDAALAAAVDRTEFTALARTDAESWGESEPAVRPWSFDPTVEPRGPLVLAAALERGGGMAKDVVFRPTRIVVVGDATFALNGAFARRANANRDFLLNAVAWLAGLDAFSDSRMPGNVVATGMDRSRWIRFGVLAAGGPAACVLLLGLLAAFRRRRRS
jgi:ABC-2 type transport system permease protein